MKPLIYISALLFFISISPNVLAQFSVNASGGDIVNSGEGSVSFSIGQIAYSSIASEDGEFHEGVQQAIETLQTSGLDDLNAVNEFKLFPNPASSNAFIKVKNGDYKQFSYQIRNCTGQIIKGFSFNNNPEQKIGLSHYPNGIYLITILENNRIHSTQKLIIVK